MSAKGEQLHPSVSSFVSSFPVKEDFRLRTAQLDAMLTRQKIPFAIRQLRSSAGGGDEFDPILVKVASQDPAMLDFLVECIQELWVTSHW